MNEDLDVTTVKDTEKSAADGWVDWMELTIGEPVSISVAHIGTMAGVLVDLVVGPTGPVWFKIRPIMPNDGEGEPVISAAVSVPASMVVAVTVMS